MPKISFKKNISWALLLIFTAVHFEQGSQAWAAPVSEIHAAQAAFEIELPAELGSVQETSAGSGPAIIQIQTAHGNFEAQKNIQQTLHFLKKQYGFNFLLLEGSASRLYPELMDFFPGRKDLNLKAAEMLAREGLVKGDELFLLEENDARAYGIEDIRTYKKARKSFTKVMLQKESSEKILRDLDLRIKKTASLYLNPELRDFLQAQENFERERISFQVWMQELNQSARKHLQIDLSEPSSQFDWPMLSRAFKIQEFESSIDLKLLEKEKKLFPVDVAGISAGQVEAVLSALSENFPARNYPNLKMYFGSLILKNEIQPALLMKELGEISAKITGQLVRTQDEKKCAGLFKKYGLLRKLFALELASADYDLLLEDARQFRPSELARELKSLNRGRDAKDFDFENLELAARLFDQSLEFYGTAKERDGAMLANIEKEMKKNGVSKAVVITGGFHSKAFKDFFISRGFNYALISPKISSGQGREEYLRAAGVLKSAMDLTRRMELSSIQQIMGADIVFIEKFTAKIIESIVLSELRADIEPDAETQPLDETVLKLGQLSALWRYKRLKWISRLWRAGNVNKYGLLKYLIAERYKNIPGMRDFIIRLMAALARNETASFDEAAGELIAAYKLEELLGRDYEIKVLTINRQIGYREFDVMFWIKPLRGTVQQEGKAFFEEGIYLMEAKEDSADNLDTLIRQTVNEQVAYQLENLALLKKSGVPIKGVIVAAGGKYSSQDRSRRAGEFKTEMLSRAAQKKTRGSFSEIPVYSVVTGSFDVENDSVPLNLQTAQPSLKQLGEWYFQRLKIFDLYQDILGPLYGLDFGKNEFFKELARREQTASEVVSQRAAERLKEKQAFEEEYNLREAQADKWAEIFFRAGFATQIQAGEILDWYFLSNLSTPLHELLQGVEIFIPQEGPRAFENFKPAWEWVERKFKERPRRKFSGRKVSAPASGPQSIQERLEKSLYGPMGWIVVFAHQPFMKVQLSAAEAEAALRDYFKPAVEANDATVYRKLSKALREDVVWKHAQNRAAAWDDLLKLTRQRSLAPVRSEIRTKIIYPEATPKEIAEWFSEKIGFGGVNVEDGVLKPLDFDKKDFNAENNPWKLDYGILPDWVHQELLPAIETITNPNFLIQKEKALRILAVHNLGKGPISEKWEDMPVVPEILFPLHAAPELPSSMTGIHSHITFNLIPGSDGNTFYPVLIKTGSDLEKEAFFDAILDLGKFKDFIGVLNLPGGRKGIVYRIIPAQREVVGADELILSFIDDLFLFGAVPERLKTRFGTVPFDLANLSGVADIGAIRAVVKKYNEIYEQEKAKAAPELRETDDKLAGTRLKSELRSLPSDEEKGFAQFTEPLLKVPDQRKNLKIELENIKKDGPPVTLEFVYNQGSLWRVQVSFDGIPSGDFVFSTSPGVLQISDVQPFWRLKEGSGAGNRGVMSTILNWLAWEANEQNIYIENSGTNNLKLIHLYGKFFADAPDNYGMYDSRNAGFINLKGANGKFSTAAALDSLADNFNRYKISKIDPPAEGLKDGQEFEIDSGGQLVRIDGSNKKIPSGHYLGFSYFEMKVRGKAKNFQTPAGRVHRSELRSEDPPDYAALVEPVLNKAPDELKKIKLELKNVKENGPAITLSFGVSSGNFTIYVHLDGLLSGSFIVANLGMFQISSVYPFSVPGKKAPHENHGVMSTILNWLVWEADKQNRGLANIGTANLKLIHLYGKYFADPPEGYGLYDQRNAGVIGLVDSQGEFKESVKLESAPDGANLYRVTSSFPNQIIMQKDLIFEISSRGEFLRIDGSDTKTATGLFLKASSKEIRVEGKPKNFHTPLARLRSSELRPFLPVPVLMPALKARLELTGYLFPLDWVLRFGRTALRKMLADLELSPGQNPRLYSATELLRGFARDSGLKKAA